MADFDWNKDPESCKHWQPGDHVWIDTTLYVVEGFEDTKVNLKRHDPIRIRRMPSISATASQEK